MLLKRCTEICGRDNLGLVIECSGANIALKQAIEMTRPNAEIVRVGMGFKPLEFSINDITMLSFLGLSFHLSDEVFITKVINFSSHG